MFLYHLTTPSFLLSLKRRAGEVYKEQRAREKGDKGSMFTLPVYPLLFPVAAPVSKCSRCTDTLRRLTPLLAVYSWSGGGLLACCIPSLSPCTLCSASSYFFLDSVHQRANSARTRSFNPLSPLTVTLSPLYIRFPPSPYTN